jgi:hypothetical protein
VKQQLLFIDLINNKNIKSFHLCRERARCPLNLQKSDESIVFEMREILWRAKNPVKVSALSANQSTRNGY